MADIGYVQTSIWDDEWVNSLTDFEYRVWSFLLTNNVRTMAGIYPMPLKKMAYYLSSQSPAQLQATLAKFMADDKIYYDGNWVVLRNHFKNQKLAGAKHWEAVATAINKAPDALRQRLLTADDELFLDISTLSLGYLYTSSTLSVGYSHTIGTLGKKERKEKVKPFRSEKDAEQARPLGAAGPASGAGRNVELEGLIADYGETDGRGIYAGRHPEAV